MYCYNSILTICLCCEILKNIGSIFKENNRKSVSCIEDLLRLGDKLLDNLEDDNIEKFFLDLDFKNRTVLRIVTDNDFSPLLSSEKINILIEEMWIGKKTYECDGKISDFSLLNNLAKTKIKKIVGKNISLSEVLNTNFKPNITDEKYWY